jgi:carbonic anhydrase
MEMHIVHQDPVTSNLVVIGIFLKEGDANPFLEKIWSLMPTVENKESISTDSINLIDAFPSDKKYYTYTGSLTTPPCSQGIDWIIIKEPMEISSEQIKKFSDIHPDNSRPTQPLNNREVIEGI